MLLAAACVLAIAPTTPTFGADETELIHQVPAKVSDRVTADGLSSIKFADRSGATLIVHVGTTDGKLEISLARGGRRLVHGLARDAAAATLARRAIAAAGLYGLASVEVFGDRTKLPYADNMVNLLICEDDVARTELLRVLAPNGEAYLKRGGDWTVIKKPRPTTMDEWTHFDHGPDGNALSRDTQVAPPRQMQWISGIQEIKLGGNPAGFSGSSGIRLAGGRVFSDWTTGGRIKQRYGAWDAFNGLPLWSVETPYKGRRRRLHIVADGENRLFAVISDQVAETKVKDRWPNAAAALIVCFDFKSGKINWKSSEIAGKHVGQIIARGKYLGIFAGGGIGAGKNPFTANMLAASGKLLWTGTFKTEWNRAGYSMIWRDGVIYYADPWKIFKLDPKTGVETHVYLLPAGPYRRNPYASQLFLACAIPGPINGSLFATG